MDLTEGADAHPEISIAPVISAREMIFLMFISFDDG
jgi:hypothetical protein